MYHLMTYFHILLLRVDVRIVKNVAYIVLDHPTTNKNSSQNLNNNCLPKYKPDDKLKINN